MRSFREACGRDLTIRISAYVASIEDVNERFKAQTDFEFATTVSRAHFRVSQIASALSKTESEIDEVFALAQQLDLNWLMQDNHLTPFIGSLIAFASTVTSLAEIEVWLKLSSLAVGTLAGILGCISAINNLRK